MDSIQIKANLAKIIAELASKNPEAAMEMVLSLIRENKALKKQVAELQNTIVRINGGN